MVLPLLIVLASYLLGSFPTALVVIRKTDQIDIRQVGDGNMGARNATRNYGWKAGVVIALIDIGKGLVAVLLPKAFGFPVGWQMAAGAAAFLGHDFPIFASFKGGQGLATTAGCLLGLYPSAALAGFVTDGILYLLLRRSNLAASLGFAIAVMLLIIQKQYAGAGYFICMLLFIPLKQHMDKSRRVNI